DQSRIGKRENERNAHVARAADHGDVSGSCIRRDRRRPFGRCNIQSIPLQSLEVRFGLTSAGYFSKLPYTSLRGAGKSVNRPIPKHLAVKTRKRKTADCTCATVAYLRPKSGHAKPSPRQMIRQARGNRNAPHAFIAREGGGIGRLALSFAALGQP